MNNTTFNPDKYWDSRLRNIKGLEGVGFKKLGPSFNKWAYRVRKSVFLKHVAKLSIDFKNAGVLDVGSGTGFYIQIWRELGAGKITGVDITPTAINNLKQTFPQQHFFTSDIGNSAFNSEKQYEMYDVVSSMDVLFHIVDDDRFKQSIQNIASIIKGGGYFIYSDLFLENTTTMRGESQVCRTHKHLMDVFEKNGFELVVIKPFMYFTNKPVDSRNPLMKVLWFLLENGLYVMPFLGRLFGPLLYPFEMLLVNTASNSPTTEFAIFRKKTG